MPRRIYDPVSGRMVWVGDDGRPLYNVNPGLGSLPGRARQREEDLLARLPDAQLAGYTGPQVTPPKVTPRVTETNLDPKAIPTFRPLAGASQNNRGGSVIIDPAEAVFGSDPNLSDPIVRRVVETPLTTGDDAEVIAVTMGRSIVNQQLGPFGDGNQVRARLEWGVGGASFSAEVDWGRGGVIVLPASFARVSVDYRLQGPPFFGLPPIEAFAASLSYGFAGRAKSNAAKFTSKITVDPAGFVDVPVPNFATHVGIIGNTPGAATDVFLQFYGATTPTTGNSVFGGYAVSTNAAYHGEDVFVLPEFTKTIRVGNNNAVNAARLAVVFSLSL